MKINNITYDTDIKLKNAHQPRLPVRQVYYIDDFHVTKLPNRRQSCQIWPKVAKVGTGKIKLSVNFLIIFK